MGFAFWLKARFEQSEKLRKNGNAEREEKSSPEIFVWFSKLAKPNAYLAYCAASSNLIEINRDTESEPIVTPYKILARDMVSRL